MGTEAGRQSEIDSAPLVTVMPVIDARGEGLLGVTPLIEDELVYKLCAQALQPKRTFGYDNTFDKANADGEHTVFPVLDVSGRLVAGAHDLARALRGMGFEVIFEEEIYEQPQAA